MAQHTLGPWKFEPGDVSRVVRSDGSTVCCDTSYYPTPVDPDDMPVIAAAPEMLAALTELLGSYITEISSGDGGRDPDKDIDVRAARAAIAKATGQQS